MKTETKKTSKAEGIKTSAEKLFREFGYHRVSIDEVCEHACASKMTFYRHFENKAGLLRQICAEMLLSAQTQIESLLLSQEDFRHRFEAILKISEGFRERLGYRLINDLINSDDPDLKSIQHHNTQGMQDLNWRFIAAGKSSGFFRSDFSVEFTLFLAEKLKEIITDERFSSFYPNFSEGHKAVIDYFYFGVAKPL